jgi:tetraprenyl-beta-curcumene synthase
MGAATHSRGGRFALRSSGAAHAWPQARRRFAERCALACAFAATVVRFSLLVLPQVRSERSRWRRAAATIASPRLRRAAQTALLKRGNIEGAALFATLAPRRHRREVVRAVVAFQLAYNYLDALSELPNCNATLNAERLHEALPRALDAQAPHLDYYAHQADRDDGGYLVALLDSCRAAFAGLPSYDAAAPTARAAAARIVDFQALNLSEPQGGQQALERWATEATPVGSGLAWWETAAASGSSLAVFALLAAAADGALDSRTAREIDGVYFPCAGALHSLLDSLVDRSEDRDEARRSLLDNYSSTVHAAVNLADLAFRARAAAERAPSAPTHRVLLTAMCSYYLSDRKCRTPEARAIGRTLTGALGVPLELAILMFRARRLAHAVAWRPYV